MKSSKNTGKDDEDVEMEYALRGRVVAPKGVTLEARSFEVPAPD